MTTSTRTPVTAPPPVSQAVKLMYAIAALGLVGAVLTAADTGGIREHALLTSPQLSGGALDAVVAGSVAAAIIGGLVGAAVWVLFAIFTGRGRGWARIVAFVLSGLAVIAGLIALLDGFALPDVATLLELLCAIGVIALLARRESSRFFAAARAARLQPAASGYASQPGYPPVQ